MHLLEATFEQEAGQMLNAGQHQLIIHGSFHSDKICVTELYF